MLPFMTMGDDMPPMSLVQRTFLPWGFSLVGGDHSLGRFFWRERPFCSGPRQRYQSLGSGALATVWGFDSARWVGPSVLALSCEAGPTVSFLLLLLLQPMRRAARRKGKKVLIVMLFVMSF